MDDNSDNSNDESNDENSDNSSSELNRNGETGGEKYVFKSTLAVVLLALSNYFILKFCLILIC